MRPVRARHLCELLVALGIATALVLPSVAGAQIGSPARPAPSYKNAASFGLSYGIQNDRNATFWGWSADYSRDLGSRWFFGAALAWDEDTETFDDRPDKVVETYTVIATISYGITRHLAITTGFGKGFADTDNPAGAMRFTNGDLGTGIALGWSTQGPARSSRDSISVSAAFEYNIAQNETSVSFDINYGWSF